MVSIVYRNWKGKVATRHIIPKNIEWKETTWHPKAQWILNAYDLEKEDMRGFAIADILAWNS